MEQPRRTAFSWWLLKLYRQPAAFFALLLVIPSAAVCLWLYAVNERQWRTQEGQDLLVAARLAARIIEEELTRTREIADAVAGRPAFTDAFRRQDRPALTAALRLLVDVTPAIDRVMAIDPAGRLLAEVPARAAAEPPFPDPSDQPPADGTQPVSGVYLRDQASGEKVVGVSSVVREGEDALGVLQVQYRLQRLSRWLEKVRIEPAGFLYVADRQGFLVAYPFQLLPGKPKDVSGWAPVSREVSAQRPLIRFQQGHPARAWTAAVVAIDPFGWRVVAQQPDAAMLQPFRHLVWSFGCLLLLIAGGFGSLGLRWARLHRATLRLVAQQARLLSLSEQRRLMDTLRRSEPKRPNDA
ncbi:MAG: cache domain-containing protein [Candidatus Omnitrophica bacterium]|nr:cache domain-containing protein [Candidatus Omnitrophota bacterium]